MVMIRLQDLQTYRARRYQPSHPRKYFNLTPTCRFAICFFRSSPARYTISAKLNKIITIQSVKGKLLRGGRDNERKMES